MAIGGALRAAGIGPGDAVAIHLPKGPDQILAAVGVLAAGGAVVTMAPRQREDPGRWVELALRQRVTVLNCVPSLLDMLLTAAAGTMLDGLRAVLLGGDWVDVALPRRLAAVPYGTPLRNVRCRVVGQSGADCPDWVSGELWIGGTGVPSRIELLAELPLTANGKPDRKAIGALLESGDPRGEIVTARTDLERALADIVATVLGGDRVGVTDDFFSLGGDSVLATTVVAQVRELLDSPDAVVADLLLTGTVAGPAQRLLDREARGGSAGRLESVAQIYLTVAGMSDEDVLDEF